MTEIQKQHVGTGEPTTVQIPAEAHTAPAAWRDPVDEAGDESFPCSDPPSWTTGCSVAARAR